MSLNSLPWQGHASPHRASSVYSNRARVRSTVSYALQIKLLGWAEEREGTQWRELWNVFWNERSSVRYRSVRVKRCPSKRRSCFVPFDRVVHYGSLFLERSTLRPILPSQSWPTQSIALKTRANPASTILRILIAKDQAGGLVHGKFLLASCIPFVLFRVVWWMNNHDLGMRWFCLRRMRCHAYYSCLYAQRAEV